MCGLSDLLLVASSQAEKPDALTLTITALGVCLNERSPSKKGLGHLFLFTSLFARGKAPARDDLSSVGDQQVWD